MLIDWLSPQFVPDDNERGGSQGASFLGISGGLSDATAVSSVS